jgi:hypothetical protein
MLLARAESASPLRRGRFSSDDPTPPGQKDAVVQIEAEKKKKMALLQLKRETVWKVRFFAAAVRRHARPHGMRMRSPHVHAQIPPCTNTGCCCDRETRQRRPTFDARLRLRLVAKSG